MKQLLVLFALLVGCASSTPNKVMKAPLPSCADAKAGETCISPQFAPGAIITQKFRGEDWSIVLPLTYETGRLQTLVPEGVSMKVFINKIDTRMIVIMREDDALSRLTEPMYVGRFTTQMTNGGATVVGAVGQILINGKPFSKVEVNKDDAKMFVFMHVENNVAHVVMCGGKVADTQLGTACNDLVKTFQMD